MYRLKYRIALVALAVIVLAHVSNFTSNTIQFAFGCTCAGIQTPEAAFRDMTAVFSGRVIEIKEVNEFDSETLPDPYYQVYFDVEESWKGIKNDPTKVSTAVSGDMCGYEFELGKEYLVYAHGQQIIGAEDDWGTGICFRTTDLSNAQADLIVLGEGEDWTGIQSVGTERIWIYVPPEMIIIPLAIIGAIIGGIIGFRRWKRSK